MIKSTLAFAPVQGRATEAIKDITEFRDVFLECGANQAIAYTVASGQGFGNLQLRVFTDSNQHIREVSEKLQATDLFNQWNSDPSPSSVRLGVLRTEDVAFSGDREAVQSGKTKSMTTFGMIAKPGKIVELEEKLEGWTKFWVECGATACQASRAVTGQPVDRYFLNILMEHSGELDSILSNLRETDAWKALATNTDPASEIVSNTLLNRLP